jgi:hypothetical protein
MKERKMKIAKNKIAAITIALFFILSMTASTMLLPTTSAHTPPLNIPSTCFLSVSPNPVGIGQTLAVDMWNANSPPTAQGPNGDRWTFYIDVTNPTGVTTRLGPFTSDDTGGTYTTYTPTTLGNYTFKLIFPGQTLAGTNPPLWPNGVPYVGDYFMPANSSAVTVLVQQEQINYYPYTVLPMPNAYWQNPVEANNKAWSVIDGNWLMVNYDQKATNYNPYTTSPSTSHILWTKPINMGGQIGGATGNEETVYEQDMYSTAFSPAIVINGVLYYNEFTSGQALPGIVAVNLRTGQEQWIQNGTGMPVTTSLGTDQPGAVYNTNAFNRLTQGEVYNYLSPNMYGGNAYLWALNGVAGTGNPNTNPTAKTTLRFDMYDAFSGAYILSIVNCTSGTFAYSNDGSLIEYILNPTGNWLAMWNSSAVFGMLGGTYGSPSWQLRPHAGSMLQWSTGLEWNVSIDATFDKSPFPETISHVADGVILASTLSTYGTSPQDYVLDIGYNATTGQQMWVDNQTLPTADEPNSNIWTSMPASDGIFTHYDKTTQTFKAYSLYTGSLLWTTDPIVNDPLATFGGPFSMAYGIFYAGSYGGYMRAYNITTGKLLWTFSTGSSGLEWPGGVNWPVDVFSGHGVGFAVADGKVYVSTGHAYNPPVFNGARMYCLNATTGELLYTISGWWEVTVVASGELVAYNGYDNEIYAFGKGLTDTTVSAPEVGVPQGSAIVIRGTVTDQSPGQTSLGIPAAGTPAISDDSMSAWMAYLYMQQPIPTNATGVPVTLSVIDSNGNNRQIGTTTSDASGMYTFTWMPDITGNYTVTATFAGSQSYYPSSAETSFYANVPAATPAPTAAPLTNTATTTDLMMYMVPSVIAIIIAIAIVGFLILRKHA